MSKVSRSFAIVVGCLREPLLSRFSVAYLLCRVADNIEDCTESPAWKAERFLEFGRMLHDPARADGLLSAWGAWEWPGLTPDERKLMGAGAGLELWRLYAEIPSDDRAVIEQWTLAMGEGMMRLGEPNSTPKFVDLEGVQVLERKADYDGYCYIVAGTVGHMTTELVSHRYGIESNTSDRLMAASEACGRALQKTNILQDFAVDVQRGFCYIPDEWLRTAAHTPLALAGAPIAFKRLVIEDILEELEISAQYILDLPLGARDFRLASLVCLLTALQTNLVAATQQRTLFTQRHEVKLSLVAMSKCMLDARRMVGDNEKILSHSRRLQGEIRHALDDPTHRAH